MTRHKEARRSRTDRRFAGAVLFAGIVATGCTDFAGYDLDYLLGRSSVLATMRSTVSLEPQDLALLPPAGAVPVAGPGADAPPAFGQAQLDSAAATLTNPLQATPEVLARGEVLYANQCAVCHGSEGEGNGPIVGNGRFPLGPALTSGIALDRSEGYVYAIVRVGRGLMPSYGERIGHEDRWAVAHYVRQLQGLPAGGAAPAVTAGPSPAAAAEPAEPSADAALTPAESAPAPDQGQ